MKSEHLKEEDFWYIQTYIEKHTGIHVRSDASYLLSSRLKDIVDRHNLGELSELVKQLRLVPSKSLVSDVLEAVTIHETFFFRGQRIFEDLINVLSIQHTRTPEALKHIKIWSAATSSGQEAYTLNMLMNERPLSLLKSTYEILATDISNSILKKAQEGVFPCTDVARNVPSRLRDKCFMKIGNEMCKIKDTFKQNITFKQHNLLDQLPGSQSFHMILCRNVLIYFNNNVRNKIIHNLHQKLEPNGYLVLGGTETLMSMGQLFKPISRVEGLYQKI